MDAMRAACEALYHMAFPGEPEVFTKAMFDRFYPSCIRTVCEDGKPVSMLFSIPYPLVSDEGTHEAHYLYAVATHPDYRGRGLAKQLLLAEAQHYPVFLRPMTPSLFDFYAKAGFMPFSPMEQMEGEATTADSHCHSLSPTDYLTARAKLAPLPACVPTPEFLSLYEIGGGFAHYGEDAAVLYERHGDTIVFKEFWGDTDRAPCLASFLGGKRYTLRRRAANGACFGVGINVPPDASFLAALD